MKQNSVWPHRAEVLRRQTSRLPQLVLWGMLSLVPLAAKAASTIASAKQSGPQASSAQPMAATSKPEVSSAVKPDTAEDLQAWLERVSHAAQRRNYSGIFVVQSGGRMVSSTIDHYVTKGSTLEKVETLDGERRILLCQNEKTRTILPAERLVVVEDHQADFSFPRVLKTPRAKLSMLYSMQHEGQERCAGYVCEVTRITPRDDLRYGYRLWTERTSDLLVKAQTLDDQGNVLDQVAFTQLNLNPAPKPDMVAQALRGTGDYQVEHMRATPTTSRAQGWTLSKPPPGFKSVGIYQRRLLLRAKPVEVTQWLFTDGLASVSLFGGSTADTQQHGASLHMGETNALLDRKGAWSVIAIGAVPTKTLQLFAESIARLR